MLVHSKREISFQMDIEVVRRVCLARYLYELGTANLKSSNDMHLFAAVNLMQDAVEAFLIGVAEHLGARIAAYTTFDKYIVAIDEKIAPNHLPFKLQLLRLNSIRIGSKHQGIQPARDECERLAVSIREFFDVVTSANFNTSFSAISTLDLLDEGQVKAALVEAKTALETQDYAAVAINCRKVLYIEIEHNYNVFKFRHGAPPTLGIGLLGGYSEAPDYARHESYIEKNVHVPTDYIVLDHSRISAELVTRGVQPEEYWNVWRLTPEVIRNEDGGWTYKNDFDKLDHEVLINKAEYIFSTTVDVALSFQANRKRIQYAAGKHYTIALTQEGVPVYEKADKNSAQHSQTPPGVTTLSTTFSSPGLTGDGVYYQIFHVGTPFVYGFIHESYVKWE